MCLIDTVFLYCNKTSWQLILDYWKTRLFPFKKCNICKEHLFVGWAAELSTWLAAMEDLANLLFQCQTTFFFLEVAIDSYFEPQVVKNSYMLVWNMRRNILLSSDSRFCWWYLDCRVDMWMRHGEHLGDCCRNWLQILGVERMEGSDAVLTSTPLNTCWISSGVLFMPESPTQPCWLTCNMLVAEWNIIPQQCVNSTRRRRCKVVVAVYGSSTHYWGSSLLNQ